MKDNIMFTHSKALYHTAHSASHSITRSHMETHIATSYHIRYHIPYHQSSRSTITRFFKKLRNITRYHTIIYPRNCRPLMLEFYFSVCFDYLRYHLKICTFELMENECNRWCILNLNLAVKQEFHTCALGDQWWIWNDYITNAALILLCNIYHFVLPNQVCDRNNIVFKQLPKEHSSHIIIRWQEVFINIFFNSFSSALSCHHISDPWQTENTFGG